MTDITKECSLTASTQDAGECGGVGQSLADRLRSEALNKITPMKPSWNQALTYAADIVEPVEKAWQTERQALQAQMLAANRRSGDRLIDLTDLHHEHAALVESLRGMVVELLSEADTCDSLGVAGYRLRAQAIRSIADRLVALLPPEGKQS